MKVLKTTAEINKELTRLLRECSTCQIAVAWASIGFDAFALLQKLCGKIERMVVGIHFYQTHPSFIEAFLTHPKVRFMKKADELFHPKVYFFEKAPNTWECIVGGPNFTRAGFGGNDEMALLVTSADQGAPKALGRINAAMRAYWGKASAFSNEELEAYRESWEQKQPILKDLCEPLDVKTLRMTWADFFDSVKAEKAASYSRGPIMDERLKVIRVARRLFAEFPQFNKIGPDERRRLAGLDGIADGVDYGLFGSMRGVGTFWVAIKNNDENLSLALDLIPFAGSITRKTYLQYIERYKRAFPEGRAPGGATQPPQVA